MADLPLDEPLKRLTVAVGSALIGVGVFSFLSTTTWISSLLTLSTGALVLQVGSSSSSCSNSCCCSPPFAASLAADAATAPSTSDACCGSGVTCGCSGPLNRIRNVAIAGLVIAVIEWFILFPITMIAGYVQGKANAQSTGGSPRSYTFSRDEIAGTRYSLYLVGATCATAVAHIVLNTLVLQLVQALRAHAVATAPFRSLPQPMTLPELPLQQPQAHPPFQVRAPIQLSYYAAPPSTLAVGIPGKTVSYVHGGNV